MSEATKLLVKSSSNSISLCWDALVQLSCETSDEYIVKYRPKGTTKFTSLHVDPETYQCTIDNLQDDTEYDVIILASIDGSDEKLERTLLRTKASEARHFMSYSKKSVECPTVYLMEPSQIIHKRPGVRFCYFGNEQNSLGVKKKTIIVLGETGAGKSTLLDAMFNYIAGVSHGDDFRYQLVNLTEDEQAKSKSEFISLTDGITCYHIPQTGNSVLDYHLCVIDTPGFGDTRGEAFEKTIPKKIEELFKDCIDSLDAICVVVPTACVRLTDGLNNVFSSIKQLFGKDVVGNVCVLLTKDDGASGKPKVLGAIKQAGIEIHEDSYFRFNNADLFSKASSLQAWQARNQNFRHFFAKLGTMESVSLLYTNEVLKSRQRLEISLNHIQLSIRSQVNSIMNIKGDEQALEMNKQAIEENKNFEKTIQIENKVKDGKNYRSLNCTYCLTTCHDDCSVIWPYSYWIWTCEIMSNSTCTICPGRCSTGKHDVEYNVYTAKFTTVTETLEDMKERYNVELKGKEGLEKMLQINTDKLEQSLKDLDEKLSEVTTMINNLGKIALEPTLTSLNEFLTLVEEQERKSGTDNLDNRLNLLSKIKTLKEKGCPLTDLMNDNKLP